MPAPSFLQDESELVRFFVVRTVLVCSRCPVKFTVIGSPYQRGCSSLSCIKVVSRLSLRSSSGVDHRPHHETGHSKSSLMPPRGGYPVFAQRKLQQHSVVTCRETFTLSGFLHNEFAGSLSNMNMSIRHSPGQRRRRQTPCCSHTGSRQASRHLGNVHEWNRRRSAPTTALPVNAISCALAQFYFHYLFHIHGSYLFSTYLYIVRKTILVFSDNLFSGQARSLSVLQPPVPKDGCRSRMYASAGRFYRL